MKKLIPLILATSLFAQNYYPQENTYQDENTKIDKNLEQKIEKILQKIKRHKIKKHDTFISLQAGIAKDKNINPTSFRFISLRYGRYMYTPNIYKINNRWYLEFNKYLKENNYSGSFNIDWIFTQANLKPFENSFRPFLGLNVGYLKAQNSSESSSFYGFNAGGLFELADNLELEFSGKYSLLDNNQKHITGGILFTISF